MHRDYVLVGWFREAELQKVEGARVTVKGQSVLRDWRAERDYARDVMRLIFSSLNDFALEKNSLSVFA